MKPVHHEVKAALLRRIQHMALESQLPSDRDLAREFNVAFLTINRVMNDLEREGYVERRPRKGTFLASHERTVTHGDEPRGGGEGTIVMAYPNWFSYHYWRHIRLAEELAIKNGLQLLEYKLTPESSPERMLAFARHQPELRGLLMLPVPTQLSSASLAQLNGLSLPVVMLSCAADVGPYPHLHAYDTDWQRAGWLAADAFLRAGHRRLAWINNEPGRDDRLVLGMRQALKEHGRRASDLVTLGLGVEPWSDARETGYRLTQRLLDGGEATAAFVDSLTGVQGSLRALWERNLRAPEHLSLMTSGIQSGEEDYLTPPLSTIDSDWSEELRWAFATLLGTQPAGERSRLIPVRLSERSSIGAPVETSAPI